MIVANAIGILAHFPQYKEAPRIRQVQEEVINKEIPWGYFDGAAQGNPTLCGGGAALYFSDQNYITYKEGLGEGTNNFAELRALRLLITKAMEWCCRSLQIFKDSMIIINWENGIQRCHIIKLLPFPEEIFLFEQHFDSLTITHVYRERNRLADSLSKEGVQLQAGHIFSERILRDPEGFYHRPYHEEQIVEE